MTKNILSISVFDIDVDDPATANAILGIIARISEIAAEDLMIRRRLNSPRAAVLFRAKKGAPKKRYRSVVTSKAALPKLRCSVMVSSLSLTGGTHLARTAPHKSFGRTLQRIHRFHKNSKFARIDHFADSGKLRAIGAYQHERVASARIL